MKAVGGLAPAAARWHGYPCSLGGRTRPLIILPILLFFLLFVSIYFLIVIIIIIIIIHVINVIMEAMGHDWSALWFIAVPPPEPSLN